MLYITPLANLLSLICHSFSQKVSTMCMKCFQIPDKSAFCYIITLLFHIFAILGSGLLADLNGKGQQVHRLPKSMVEMDIHEEKKLSCWGNNSTPSHKIKHDHIM